MYKDEIIKAMQMLAQDDAVRVIGYNTVHGGRAGGTFDCFPPSRCIEMPVAENLMVGMAVGLSLQGYKPLVYFERFDFVLNSADQIINHLAAIPHLSKGQFNPTAIIRVVAGNWLKPLYTGPTHCRDHTRMFESGSGVRVRVLRGGYDVMPQYSDAYDNLSEESSMLVEHKDLYDAE